MKLTAWTGYWMSFFIHVWPHKDGTTHYGVWDVQPTLAIRVGVPRAEEHPNSHVRASGSENVWDAIRKKFPDHEFTELQLAPGRFFPRMARPSTQHPPRGPGLYPVAHTSAIEIANYRGQLTVLTRELERICQTVHPCEATLKTFGHDIRNLLILACTEVEAHWRGVLLANAYPDGRLTTNDYVKVASAMRLREFAVRFPRYPWLNSICPFEGWGLSGRPTRELEWFTAYHAVKHDRERQFERATLGAAFSAVTACAVMMLAQYGNDGLLRDNFFNLEGTPLWHPSEGYTHLFQGPNHTPLWAPQNYPF
jgi:hypothetical protein